MEVLLSAQAYVKENCAVYSTVITNQGFSSWYNQIHTDCLCPGIFCENDRFYFIFYKICYQI